jgi:Fe-S cluster assembly protein SufD
MTIHQTKIKPAITAAEQRFLDLYAGAAEKLPGAGSAAVKASREAALEQFAALGVPHRRVEEWKYTDLRMLMPEAHPLGGLAGEAQTDVSVEAAIGKPLAHLDAYRAVFINGRFRADLSSVQDAPGVAFDPLSKLLEADGSAAHEIANRPLGKRDVVGALSTALATDGAVLSVSPKARLEKPIHLIVIASGDTPHLFALQHAISIGDGADVTLVETHASDGQTQALSFTRLSIGADASLKHVRVTEGASAKQLASADVTLGAGANYEPAQIVLDSAIARYEAGIRFDGPNAKLNFTGAMALRGHSHADFTLVVDHAAPHCESRELVKAVLGGRARGVFQGKVIVQRGAQKTDGKQMANALLLSDDAEFDSKPELEIFADDVACGHGSTAGQLDPDMLFYLRARGIPEAEARALLIAAFIGQALDKIENEDLRAALEQKVACWLAGDSATRDPAI